jgi:hypothetical protein
MAWQDTRFIWLRTEASGSFVWTRTTEGQDSIPAEKKIKRYGGGWGNTRTNIIFVGKHVDLLEIFETL